MYEMAIIIPTFNRPENIRRVAQAFSDTCEMESTSLYFVMQREDPNIEQYNTAQFRDEVRGIYWNARFHTADAGIGGTGFVRPTNWMARKLLRRARPPQYIGFMGDDHLPRTRGWDQRFIATLSVPGVGYVFGDDGFQRADLSSHIVMKRQIPEALGYFAHPAFKHLYADNVWLETGKATNSIMWLGSVLIEHIHPHANKAHFDATYDIGNNPGRWLEDGEAWDRWIKSDGGRDVVTVQKLVSEGKI